MNYDCQTLFNEHDKINSCIKLNQSRKNIKSQSTCPTRANSKTSTSFIAGALPLAATMEDEVDIELVVPEDVGCSSIAKVADEEK